VAEGSVLIQHAFNIDASKLQLTEFAELHAKAIYLEKRRLRNDAAMQEVLLTNQAEMIAEIFFTIFNKAI
jgi:hypothetical protein